MLYDLVSCPHRVTMDLFADPTQQDAPNPFVQLLWEKGSLFEKQVIEGLEAPFTDLSPAAGDEKERLTLEAMQRGDSLIYSGRMQAAGLPRDETSRSSSPATRTPDSEKSGTMAKASREKSSTMHKARNFRPSARLSETKSRLQRSPGRLGTTVGFLVPKARLRPRLRRTASPSSR